MADKKKPGTKQLVVAYIIVATIIGAVIWGATAVLNHPQQTHTISTPKPTQAASTKPEVASVTVKLETVMADLKKQYKDVNDSYIFTASKDPAGGLNKSGYYTAGAAFCDTTDTLYTPKDTSDSGGSSNAYGFECGGVLEKYASAADAAKQIAYLKSVTTEPNTGKCITTDQGNSECSYVQSGDVVVHVSDIFTDTQQQSILSYLSEQATALGL